MTADSRDIEVAVAIVTFRSAALSIACLRSIEPELSTPGVRISVIVVDNASGDAAAIGDAIEKNHWSSWVTLIDAPRNGGFAYGNNVAIAHAYKRGPPDYIHLLNPDTELRKGAVGALVRFLETHRDVGIAGSSFENLDGSDWPTAFRFPTLLSEFEGGLQFGLATRLMRRWVVPVHMSKVTQPIDWVPGASMMVRRAVIDVIGGLDENYFLYFDETDFCLRAKRAGFPTWYVPESRVMHILGQSTKVTEVTDVVKRLPGYWFESRRRYFSTAYGLPYAVLVDVVAVIANCAGIAKRFLYDRNNRKVPHYLRDLIRHSAVWPKNWHVSAIQHFEPHP